MKDISSVNGDQGGDIGDWFIPDDVFHYTIDETGMSFPPAADLPEGGALYFAFKVGEGQELLYSKTANSLDWPLPPGWFPVAFNEPDTRWVRASSGTIQLRACVAEAKTS